MKMETLTRKGCALSEIESIEKFESEYELWCSDVIIFLKQSGYSKEILTEAKTARN